MKSAPLSQISNRHYPSNIYISHYNVIKFDCKSYVFELYNKEPCYSGDVPRKSYECSHKNVKFMDEKRVYKVSIFI